MLTTLFRSNFVARSALAFCLSLLSGKGAPWGIDMKLVLEGLGKGSRRLLTIERNDPHGAVLMISRLDETETHAVFLRHHEAKAVASWLSECGWEPMQQEIPIPPVEEEDK